jgi:hypothetical protein
MFGGFGHNHPGNLRGRCAVKVSELFFLRTTTPGNNRKHWTAEARKAKEQRTMVCNRFRYGKPLPPFPVRVVMTRYSTRRLDPQNMPGAMKHVIDGVADAYQINDNDMRWVFEYKQEKSLPPTMHAVKVEIESI